MIRERMRQIAVVVAKDLLLELRTREVLWTAGLFSVVLVTLFVFSGFETAAIARGAAPGVLWVSLAFVGTLVFTRTFQREKESRVLDGLLLVPGSVDALFVGKLIINIVLLAALELVLVPMVVVTFRVELAAPNEVALALILGTVGYSALGTVLAASLASVKLREVLLPLVLFPLSIPLFVCGVRATHSATAAGGDGQGWLSLMAAIDVLYLVLASWLFRQAVDHGE
jgi:heme exporter protein CcmB